MAFEQLQLKNQLCHRLYMASNSIARAYREPLAALNLTYPQYVVMMALWQQDQISIAQLIDKTSIDGGAMTQILKKMEDKALLKIVKDEQDKRKRLVKLTLQGNALQDAAAEVPQKIMCKFTHVEPQQVQVLIQLLDLIVNDLAD